MFPTINIGALQLPVYPLAWGAAIFVIGALSFHRLVNGGVPAGHASRAVLLTIWGGFLGAFLARVLLSLSQSLALTGEAKAHSGLSFVGVIIGGSAVGLIWARRYPFSLLRGLDLGWIVTPLGQAIGRIGCIGAGCCYGKLTDGPLAMYLPNVHGEWAWRYPTQLMALIANLLIFVTLLAVERYGKHRASLKARAGLRPCPRGATPDHTWPFDGFLFLLYVELYSLKRFILEFLRADAEPVLGPLTVTHVLCGVITIITLVILTGRALRTRTTHNNHF